MKSFSALTTLLFCFVTAGLGASQAQAPTGQWQHLFAGAPILAGNHGAWIVQSPKVVSTGQTGAMVFGPGRDEAVIASRQRTALTPQMLMDSSLASSAMGGDSAAIVNLATGARRPLVLPRNDLRIDYFSWLSSRILMASATGPEWQGLVLIDTLTGSSMAYQGGGWPVVSALPHVVAFRPTPVVGDEKDSKPQMDFLDFSVNPPVLRRVTAPALAANAYFLTKNQTLICRDGAGQYVELDPSSGAVKAWQGDPELLGLNEEGKVLEKLDSPPKIQASVRGGAGGGLWVGEDVDYVVTPGRAPGTQAALRPSMMVSKDCDRAIVNSAGTRVLFRSLGTGYSLEFTPIDLEAAINALMAAARTVAMSNAKQAALASMIYSADYDDFLPISGAQATDAVMPYIRSAEILNSVVWTNLSGQKLNGISDPAAYELGYVPGPGGRAIIYADGHVGWRPDK